MSSPPGLVSLAVGSAVLHLVSRWPLAARRLWDHDSVQFALGVEDFDLAAHHPHPPGYPVYVALLKLLARAGVEATTGMVGLSVLVSSLGAFFAVLVAAELVASSREAGGGVSAPSTGSTASTVWTGVFSGALYTFNPILWFYSELPLTYGVEAGLSVALAYGVLRMGKSPGAWVSTCGLFALIGGLRPSTLVLLTPLFGFGVAGALATRQLSRRVLGAGLLVLLAVGLAWGLPLLWAAGGWSEYRRISGEHFQALLPQTSVLYGAGVGAAAHNIEVLLKWSLQGLVPGGVVLLLLWLADPRAALPGLRQLASRLSFLLVWIVPPFLFFTLFHITKAGYTLVFLPALLLALTLLAAPALRSRRALLAVLAVAVLGTGLFLFGSRRSPDQPRLLALVRQEFNHPRIRRYEAELDAVRRLVATYSPESTVLVTVELAGTGAAASQGFLYPWHRHLQWYLPEYAVRLLVPGEGFALSTRGHGAWKRVGREVGVDRTTRTVLFVLAAPPGERLPLPSGEVRFEGSEFYVVEAEFTPGMRIGELRLVPF